MPITHKELEARIQQIAEEFGLTSSVQEVADEESGIFGKVVSMGEEMLDLPPDKLAELERWRYELQTDLHGRHISFETELLQPGDARLQPDELDPIEMEHINLRWASGDLKSILALARTGALLVPFLMSDTGLTEGLSDEQTLDRLRELIAQELPSVNHYVTSTANTTEMAQACEFMSRLFGHNRDLSNIENVTPEDIIGGGK